MKKNSLYVHIVLDSSGSMLRNKSVTLKACNDYIVALDPGTVVTVDRFAYKSHRLRDACPKDAASLTPNEYPCEGGTALYDAIGQAVASIDQKAKDFDRIALVVQTDGMEMNSTEFTLASIRQILQDKQEGEGWLIAYLGAGLAATQQFAAMGATASNVANYAGLNASDAFSSVSRATRAYTSSATRATGRLQSAFTAAERKNMK